MSKLRYIRSAFISVWDKGNLDKIVEALHKLDIRIYSTGGTADFIEKMNRQVTRVEDITGFPSVFGGRVKTLHPKIFGGILARRDVPSDTSELEMYGIPLFDLVVVDLYPFGETVSGGAPENEIIEKIDIGGISLIRAAAKNFKDVLVIPSKNHYKILLDILGQIGGGTEIGQRRRMAGEAFRVSAGYDKMISNYFTEAEPEEFSLSMGGRMRLRYGENPHQKASYYSSDGFPFKQLHGKEISYNNILDIDAACSLIAEFSEPTFAILKHNNACGVASRETIKEAWDSALAGDPVSAFGGVLVTNREVDNATAHEINNLFFEVIISPGYTNDALEVLKQKKNRIILIHDGIELSDKLVRSVTGGILVQERDSKTESANDLKVVTMVAPGKDETEDLIFANKVVKHSKSNAIVLIKDKQLIGSGVGQTSRIDALRQAIDRARSGGFDTASSVLASDAFFPFADSVETAFKAGITAIIQPGGSLRDQDSIDFCNKNKMKMVFTGVRHFRH